jgi:translation initiation factor 2 beta subunit (eIF-2beta)/eIF-5
MYKIESLTGSTLAHNGQPERGGRILSRHRTLEAAQKKIREYHERYVKCCIVSPNGNIVKSDASI